ncbi:hypothetical protein V6N12_040094 [Hibiscus sabdariffa]|uniref:Uncharacterized protein n=1 Tax=Hibiscus sabdariffa TaxID=183260 RepID=A0ABR2E334_9ROSI
MGVSESVKKGFPKSNQSVSLDRDRLLSVPTLKDSLSSASNELKLLPPTNTVQLQSHGKGKRQAYCFLLPICTAACKGPAPKRLFLVKRTPKLQNFRRR